MHLKAHLIENFVLILETSLAFHCDSPGKGERQGSLHVTVLATVGVAWVLIYLLFLHLTHRNICNYRLISWREARQCYGLLSLLFNDAIIIETI
jgi:hypothetical protein